ncbi:MAG: YaaA family protein [Atopobiaceae bacterium]
MLFLISPAKQMQADDGLAIQTAEPRFLAEAEELAAALRALGKEGAQKLWRTSAALTERAWEITEHLPEELACGVRTPSVMAYIGIQYQHLAPSVMTERELSWLDEHLRILSGLYGVVAPADGIVPYRLEMGAKLAVAGAHDLYGFWGGKIAASLAREPGGELFVMCASHEYARAVLPQVPRGVRVLSCEFLAPRRRDGKLSEAAPEVKAARGCFVRWCAEQGIEDASELVRFAERGYRFAPELSDEEHLAFVRSA